MFGIHVKYMLRIHVTFYMLDDAFPFEYMLGMLFFSYLVCMRGFVSLCFVIVGSGVHTFCVCASYRNCAKGRVHPRPLMHPPVVRAWSGRILHSIGNARE